MTEMETDLYELIDTDDIFQNNFKLEAQHMTDKALLIASVH